MNRWMQRAAAVIFLVGLGATRLPACGIAWTTPKNHFDGVDERGFVEWFEKIGELGLGKDLKIPLNISFRSDRETVSPYVGKFFQFPLLESHIVQLDERNFRMVTPDGWFWYFGRSKPTDTTIKGASNWAGEIRGNAITIWTDCGWKLEYVNGKISSMSDKSHRLDFVRSGSDGTVTELRCGGVAVLRVERDSMTGEAKVLVYGDKRIGIELGSRLPVVQGVKDMDRTLKTLTLADGNVHQFENGVNKDGRPNLKIVAKGKEDRIFAWDAKSRTILSDNDWRYSIQPAVVTGDCAAIGRKNANQEEEFWFYEGSRGREEVLTTAGIRTVRTWFTTGMLAGKPRKLVQTTEGRTSLSCHATYDEKGRLIRELKEDGTTQHRYDANGNQIEVVRNGQTEWTKHYDSRGRVVRYEKGNETSIYRYIDDGSLSLTELGFPREAASRGHKYEEHSVNGTKEKMLYSESGRLLASVDQLGALTQYSFDSLDRMVATSTNGVLTAAVSYDQDSGRPIARLFFDSTGTQIREEHRMEYDSNGIMSKTVILNHADNKEDVITVDRDKLGRIVRWTSNLAGTYTYKY